MGRLKFEAKVTSAPTPSHLLPFRTPAEQRTAEGSCDPPASGSCWEALRSEGAVRLPALKERSPIGGGGMDGQRQALGSRPKG